MAVELDGKVEEFPGAVFVNDKGAVVVAVPEIVVGAGAEGQDERYAHPLAGIEFDRARNLGDGGALDDHVQAAVLGSGVSER